MALTRESILGAEDLPREKVAAPEWGGEVWVRTLTATERDAFEASVNPGKGAKNLANFRARLAVLCVVDERGERLFKDEDAAALGAKSGTALDRITDVALRLSGLSEAGQKEAEGNSAAVPS